MVWLTCSLSWSESTAARTTLLGKGPAEQFGDRLPAGFCQHPGSGSREVIVADDHLGGCRAAHPVPSIPSKPRILGLVEDVQRLVAELGELGPPTRAALDGLVVQDGAHDEDFLPVIDLVPDALKNLAQRRAVGVAAVHQARNVFEADVAGFEFLVIQNAYTPLADAGVPFKTEVDLLDAELRSHFAKAGFRPRGAATE